MNNVLNLLSEETFREKMDAQNALLAALASGGGGIAVSSWADVQRLVRLGLAGQYFSVGDQLTCNRGSTELVWDVIGIDHDTPADAQYTHSMTLQLHDVCTQLPMTSGQHFYVAETALPAGTYYCAPSDSKKPLALTLKTQIPAGGHIRCISTGSVGEGYAPFVFYTYGTSMEVVALDSNLTGAYVDEVPEGGTLLSPVSPIYAAAYGTNVWKDADLRQWLNAKEAGGAWWTAASTLTKPYGQRSSNGFLCGMDEDFLAVLGKVKKSTALDGAGSESEDLVFLLSMAEVGGSANGTVTEGAPYAYYDGGGAAGRVKYQSGTAASWMLRSPTPTSAYGYYTVSASGIFSPITPTSSGGIAPACCIV